MREEDNKFYCFICQKTRYRGLLVCLKLERKRHVFIKVCQSEDCLKKAKAGQFDLK